MRIEIAAKTLSAAAALAQGVTGGVSALSDIYKHVLVSAHADGRVTMTVTDDRNQLTHTIRAERVTEPGAVCLRAETLASLARALPVAAIVSLECADGDAAAHLTFPRGSYQIPCLPAVDYPPVASERYDSHALVDAATYAKKISAVSAYAEAENQTRYYLGGVYHEMSNGNLRLVATDGRNLGVTEVVADGEVAGCIIPRNSVKTIAGALAGVTGNVKISTSPIKIRYTAEGLDLVCRVIDGQYPDYQKQILGMDFTASAVVPRSELRETLQRMSAVAEDVGDATLRTKAVYFTVDPDGALLVYTSAADVEELPAETQTESERTTFSGNMKAIMAALAIGGEYVKIDYDKSAMRLTDPHGDCQMVEYTLVMLMRMTPPQIAVARAPLRIGHYARAA